MCVCVRSALGHKAGVRELCDREDKQRNNGFCNQQLKLLTCAFHFAFLPHSIYAHARNYLIYLFLIFFGLKFLAASSNFKSVSNEEKEILKQILICTIYPSTHSRQIPVKVPNVKRIQFIVVNEPGRRLSST